jgi:hypothetical protein
MIAITSNTFTYFKATFKVFLRKDTAEINSLSCKNAVINNSANFITRPLAYEWITNQKTNAGNIGVTHNSTYYISSDIEECTITYYLPSDIDYDKKD